MNTKFQETRNPIAPSTTTSYYSHHHHSSTKGTTNTTSSASTNYTRFDSIWHKKPGLNCKGFRTIHTCREAVRLAFVHWNSSRSTLCIKKKYVCVYIYICISMYMHIHMYTYVHMYTQPTDVYHIPYNGKARNLKQLAKSHEPPHPPFQQLRTKRYSPKPCARKIRV